MILLPAIDILDGKAVRLAGGSFEEQTVYDTDPADAALRWVEAGAQALHVVDLDGAREGRLVNLDHVARIAARAGVPIQVGGGARSMPAVEQLIDAGAERVVMGTAASGNDELLEEVVARLGERLVVSVDARGGRVAVAGWLKSTELTAVPLLERLSERGVTRFVYSSIDRDGRMAGPDLEGLRQVAGSVQGSFLYSGGVSSLEDLRAISALGEAKLSGVIVGKALYECRFTLAEGQRALDGEA